MDPERNTDKAWAAFKEEDGYYWYNDQGYPQGPYDTMDHAWQGLDDYDATYYDD
jgi:hypothetical protein